MCLICMEEGKVGNKGSSDTTVLKQVFDGYIEDTITDEQVLKILEPVLKLIEQGAFDRPRSIFGRGKPIWTRPVESLFKRSAN